VLVGLGGATLASVAGSRAWAVVDGRVAAAREVAVSGADVQPLAAALGLVSLAAWGVVLVLRGRSRRVVAVVGLLAALGSLAATVPGFTAAQDAAVEAALARGATGDTLAVHLTAWYYACGGGALLAAAALAVAVVRSPRWPAMGSRYDAPSGRARPAAGTGTQEDMWRALDEGRDPTS
jgi:uncharacterized membrane protein (TIGR02234 family)